MENEVKPGTSQNAESGEVPPSTPKSEEVKGVVAFGNHGDMKFENHLQLSQAAQLAIQMKMVPDHLAKEGFKAVMAAMIFCRQFNLPDKAMNQMAFIKGKLTQFGSLVTGIAETHPEFGDKEEFWVDEKGERICAASLNLAAKAFAAVCRVKPNTATVWSEYVFTMEDASVAGLYPPTKWNYEGKIRVGKIPDTDSPWLKYPKDMMMHKARARALYSNYASVLNGVQYHEDVLEVIADRDVTPEKPVSLTDEEAEALLQKNA